MTRTRAARAVVRASILLLAVLLAACAPVASLTPTPTLSPVASLTPSPTATLRASPTPSPTPKPRVLRICLGAEPASLYLYGDSSYAAQLIRQALYDGPIDTLSYTYQPVILERIPSLDYGDAYIERTPIEPGMRVVDDAGDVITLDEGARIRPAGCRSTTCAVVFEGQPLEMDVLYAVFVIKEGVTWSDGEPVTAEDSVFSFELARNRATPDGKWREMRTDTYEAADPATVVWTGLPGFVDTDYQLAFWTPLPKHVWGKATAAELLVRDDAVRQPLGYGPYVIVRWEPGREIRLRANPTYFRAEEGLPAFDELIFSFISAEDPDQVLDTLNDGRCDLLTLETYPDRALERLKAMDAEGEAQMLATPGIVWEHLTFNVAPLERDRLPIFANVTARRAVAHCIDRSSIASELTGGLCSALDLYIPDMHPLATGGYPTYPYDPERGQALLAELGWRDEDGDGTREAHGVEGIPDNAPLAITYATTPSTLRARVADHIARALRACGFTVEVRTAPLQEFYAQSSAGLVYARQFDLAQFAWLTGVHPPCELFMSSAIPTSDNAWDGSNVGGFSDLAFDEACAQSRAALPGEQGFTQAHWEAQRIFAESLPALPLYYRPKVIAARSDLLGVVIDPIAVETIAIESFQRPSAQQ